MRILEPTLLLLLCLGCGDDTHRSKSEPSPDQGFAGEGGASASMGASDTGGSASSDGGGASGGTDAAQAGADDSGGAGGSADEGLLPDQPDNGTHGGKRLKAEWYDFDGSRVFADFYDTELKAPCTLGAWSDGKTYCIPVSTAALGYTAKACDEMLGYVSFNPACEHASPGYLVLSVDDWRCGAASAHVYRLSATSTGLMQYFAPQNGACSGPYATGYGNSDTFLVTGEVMPSDLVEFTREAPADPGRLSRQYVVSADGARLAIAPYDSQLDSDCSPKTSAGRDKGWCAPTDAKDVRFYTDSDCQQGVATMWKECKKPRFAQELADRSCALGAANFYAVGDAIPTPPVFGRGATACVASSISSENAAYALAGAVTVQPLTRAHDGAAGLQPIYFSDGKKRFLDQNLYDTAHDTECQIYVQPDGTATCVPYGASASAFYEETCTSFFHVGLVYVGVGQCEAPPPAPFVTNPYAVTTGCKANFEIDERGSLHNGKAYLSGGGADSCSLYTGLEPYQLYDLGPAHPFSEFPTASKVRDK